jgi:hypothetical protein
MEWIVATYQLGDHRLDVIELVDEDLAWYQVAVDGQMLPPDVAPATIPSEAEARSLLHDWLAGRG